MRRIDGAIHLAEWLIGLALVAGGALLLREMGVKIPPEITDKITQIINTIMQR